VASVPGRLVTRGSKPPAGRRALRHTPSAEPRRDPPAGPPPAGSPADPGVSHLHAVLIAEPDGGWVVLGPGSANGTQVNVGDIPEGR
jgi:pSer/pThr/pTyr-binding forkhead associated (FHA) protein